MLSTEIEGPTGIHRSNANSQSRELLNQNGIILVCCLIEFRRKRQGNIIYMTGCLTMRTRDVGLSGSVARIIN